MVVKSRNNALQRMEQSVPLMEKKMASPKRQSIELSTSEFGKLVRTYRIQRRLSQQQLADKWGHSREYISQIERGMRKLDRVDQVNRLADILEIPPERLSVVCGRGRKCGRMRGKEAGRQ